MLIPVQEPFVNNEIDGKKMKKKRAQEKVTELNRSLKEETIEAENAVDVTHDKKKKKKEKKNKLVTESIDVDKKKSDIESVFPEELKTSLSEETTDTKDKKKKKKKKSELNESLKEENDTHTTEAENGIDVADHKKKKHKKKNKIETESIDGDEKKPEEKPKASLSEETYNTKDKKKKKKSELNVSLKEENDVQATEAENDVDVTSHKKKKQKKNKLVTESTDGDEKKSDIESVLPVEKPKTSPSEETTNTKDKKKKKKSKKETEEVKSLEPLDIGEDNNQISKKRKRSDEIEVQPAEEITVKDSKRRKSEGLEVNSKQVVANGEITGNDPLKLSKNGPERSGQKQQRNDSAEPKTVHAFQRVKIDEVEFVDDRLQDNSYWAKSGAEKGYGAKAQEILGQVKGRDFRHEKTKKKRGSYRGGLIDQDSHSIKFNYSDEE